MSWFFHCREASIHRRFHSKHFVALTISFEILCCLVQKSVPSIWKSLWMEIRNWSSTLSVSRQSSDGLLQIRPFVTRFTRSLSLSLPRSAHSSAYFDEPIQGLCLSIFRSRIQMLLQPFLFWQVMRPFLVRIESTIQYTVRNISFA